MSGQNRKSSKLVNFFCGTPFLFGESQPSAVTIIFDAIVPNAMNGPKGICVEAPVFPRRAKTDQTSSAEADAIQSAKTLPVTPHRIAAMM